MGVSAWTPDFHMNTVETIILGGGGGGGSWMVLYFLGAKLDVFFGGEVVL